MFNASGVDSRYDHPGKRYLPVLAYFHEDGYLEPLSFDWRNEDRSVTTYEIESVRDVRKAASRRAGGAGIRYTVKVRGRELALFFELDKWFIEQ